MGNIKFNGSDINTIKFNGSNITKIYKDGVLLWPEEISSGVFDENGVLLQSWEDTGMDPEQTYSANVSSPGKLRYWLLNASNAIKKSVVKIVLPESITKISSFWGELGLENAPQTAALINKFELVIPESVTTIEDYSLRGAIYNHNADTYNVNRLVTFGPNISELGLRSLMIQYVAPRCTCYFNYRGTKSQLSSIQYLMSACGQGAIGYTGTYVFHCTDGDISYNVSCFLSGTKITLSDGNTKNIEDITYSDKLKVWDFDSGEYGEADICWLTDYNLYNNHHYELTFDDGTVLKTTGTNSNHKVYNVDERYFKGVDKTEVGDKIFAESGIRTVVKKEYFDNENVLYYNLITSKKINCFANGILTSDRYGNLYPIDESMKYIKDGRNIRPYSEFETVGIEKYWYDHLRLGESSDTVDECLNYVCKCKVQMRPFIENS